MKNTKEVHIKNWHDFLFRIVTFVIVAFLSCGISGELYSSNAALLSIHNHITDDTYNYSRAGVRYKVNGTIISTNYPGIILSNGAAVGPCKAVFEDGLGVSCDYSDGKNTFSLQYGSIIIQMTLGNTEATVNGVKKQMNNAPFVYSFNNTSEKYLYVPTRFVAETFGFSYEWDNSTATASIVRPNMIYDNTEQIRYTGESPCFSLNGVSVVSDDYPGYVFNDIAFFSAEEYFKDTGIASYAYSEGSGLIVFVNGTRTVRMVLESPVAYINDTSYLLPEVPRLIAPTETAKAEVYVPAEFVAKALGYEVSYIKNNDYMFEVTGTPQNRNENSSDSSDANSSLPENVIPSTESYSKILFSNETLEQVYRHYTDLGYQVPYSITAFSCLNSEAIYLKGIDLKDVTVTDKEDILEIELAGYYNPFGGKMYYTQEADFLNFCYVGNTSTFRFLIIKTNELHYYMYEAPDGCVIHFTNTLGLYQDRLTFTVRSDEVDDGGASEENNTGILSGTDMEELLPEAIFTREHFVIRLPENINQNAITDTDLYSQKKFTISIPGNHMAFLSEQDTYNPVATLESVRFSYKAADDTTIITFITTKIQGYSITISGGYLGIRIADPPEIYDKIIVLDAGHGGIDPGTLRGSVYEKTINYNVVNIYATEYFKDSDIKVYLTRTTDTKIALQTRADFAATVGADLFISFHVNANSSSAASGTSVYYSASNNNANASGLKSSVLAKTIVDYLSAEWGTRNRGILTEKFVVVHNNTVPAVLVECGYITNDSDFQKIKDTAYQKKAAKALFEAVTEIFEKYPTKR